MILQTFVICQITKLNYIVYFKLKIRNMILDILSFVNLPNLIAYFKFILGKIIFFIYFVTCETTNLDYVFYFKFKL